jgi:HlyD family secretion protein
MLDKKKIIFGFATLVIAACLLFIYITNQVGAASLILQGNIDIRQVELGFRVSGRVASLNFEEGDQVKKGDILASLDKSPYENDLSYAKSQVKKERANYLKYKSGSRPQEIEQAKAVLREREVELENAKTSLARQQKLVNSGIITRQGYDNIVSRVKEANAQLQVAKESLDLAQDGFRDEDIIAAEALLDAAKAKLMSAETSLGDTDVIAPNDGLILTRVQENGSIVQAGTTIYSLSLINPVWVRAYISERDLGLIKHGMKAKIITDTKSLPDFEGKIGFISPQAEFTPKNIETKELRTDLVYRIKIIIDDSKNLLKQGMPVTVKIDMAK